MSWYASVKELCFIQKYWGIRPTPILMLELKYQGQCFFCKWRASNGFSEKKKSRSWYEWKDNSWGFMYIALAEITRYSIFWMTIERYWQWYSNFKSTGLTGFKHTSHSRKVKMKSLQTRVRTNAGGHAFAILSLLCTSLTFIYIQ